MRKANQSIKNQSNPKSNGHQNQSKSIKINQIPSQTAIKINLKLKNHSSGSSSDGFSVCLTDIDTGRPLMIAHLLSYAVHVPLLEHLMNLF